ncbi:MAG: NAD-dependent epimerase/dehydratase family protein [Clostridia bacterium]
MKVLITGANGFIGRNLRLLIDYPMSGTQLLSCDVQTTADELRAYSAQCDFVVHLAGVNRPKDEREFQRGNADFTETLVEALERAGNLAPVLMTSSIQATLDNPYGRSKLAAEACLEAHARRTGAPALIYRLPNVFGKGCRPNYNSVVATFCADVARDLPITIDNPETALRLVYIDDVVAEILRAIDGNGRGAVEPVAQVTLGRLAEMLRGFRESRSTLEVPELSDPFTKKLYATYLSYLPEAQFAYPLASHKDARGAFTEFLRTPERGQMSVNLSHPGVIKGNHFHHTKNEKFLVVAGRGVVRFRKPDEARVIEIAVCAEELKVVDIPPGYTHNIENLGDTDMVTLMWASECFDPAAPDTYYLEV